MGEERGGVRARRGGGRRTLGRSKGEQVGERKERSGEEYKMERGAMSRGRRMNRLKEEV